MATRPEIPRSFGEADPELPTAPAASAKPSRELPARITKARSVDANTAELRERIAASSRIAVIGSLLLRR